MKKPLSIVWFKKDLRVHDHRPLARAAAQGPCLPLYIVEPELWSQPDQSPRQWLFAQECLTSLNVDLSQLGQPLCVFTGDALSIFQSLHQRHGIASLWSHQETGNHWTYDRDRRIKTWAQAHSIAWYEEQAGGVIRRLRSRDHWAQSWDRTMAETPTPPPHRLEPLEEEWSFDVPSAEELFTSSDVCENRQAGGRVEALKLLKTFLYDRGQNYRFHMSSPLTARDACSRLSPHITWGTISLREITQAVRARLSEIETDPSRDAKSWRQSLSSFLARLHWHCHFIQKLEDEPRIEFTNLHSAYDGLRQKIENNSHYAAWCEGRTGFPFIDACMRALDQDGWINFRMRAMLMSFASHLLWLPWRETGLHLARKFVDYEPGIHWSQVQMQSGTTGMNTVRIYNPVKQSQDQDPKGEFIRRYVPELKDIPDAFIHEPWLWPAFNSDLYPSPIIDHIEQAKKARDILYRLKRTPESRVVTAELVSKHGSRKRRAQTRAAREINSKIKNHKNQLVLDF